MSKKIIALSKKNKKKNKKSWLSKAWDNLNESNKIVLLISILISFYAAYLARQANQLLKQDIDKDFEIAEKSGYFDKPNPQLFIGQVPMPQRFSEIKIVYGSRPNSNRGYHISRIPWGITNKGKKTTEELTINFLYHAKGALALPDSLSEVNQAAKEQINRKAFLTEELPHDLVSYKVPTLNPNYNIAFDEQITLIPTVTQLLLEQEAGPPILGPEVFFEQRLDVFTTAKDVETNDYTFYLSKLEVNNIDSLIKKYIKFYLDVSPIEKIKNTLVLLSFNEQEDIGGVLIDQVSRKGFKAIVVDQKSESYKIFDYDTRRLLKKNQTRCWT